MSAFVRRRHRRWDRIGSFGVDVLEGRVLLAATPLATQSSFFSVNTGSSAGPATFAGATVLPSGAKHLLSFDNSATFLPLQTYSLAFSKTITIAGGAGGITESKINVTPLSITLSERLGTAGAFVSMLSGSVANQVSLLDFDKQGKQYTKWDFSDVTVSSYSVSAGGASDTGPIPLPTEAIQLSFDKVQLSNIDPNTGVVVGTPITWKLDTATPGAALAASVNSPVATAAAVPAPKPNSTQMIVDPNGNATAFDLDTASLGTARNTVTEFSATLTNPLQMVPMLANVLNGIFQTVTTTAYDSATKPLVTWEMNDADFTSVSVSASAGQNPLTSLTTAAVKVTQTTPDNSQSPAPTPDVWSFDQAARTVTGTASFAGPATIPVTQAEHTLADPGVGSGLLPVYSTQLGSQNNAGTKVLSGFSLQTDLTIGSAGLMADAVRGDSLKDMTLTSRRPNGATYAKWTLTEPVVQGASESFSNGAKPTFTVTLQMPKVSLIETAADHTTTSSTTINTLANPPTATLGTLTSPAFVAGATAYEMDIGSSRINIKSLNYGATSAGLTDFNVTLSDDFLTAAFLPRAYLGTALGPVTLLALDAAGRTYDQWTLAGAAVTNFSASDISNDGPVTMAVTLHPTGKVTEVYSVRDPGTGAVTRTTTSSWTPGTNAVTGGADFVTPGNVPASKAQDVLTLASGQMPVLSYAWGEQHIAAGGTSMADVSILTPLTVAQAGAFANIVDKTSYSATLIARGANGVEYGRYTMAGVTVTSLSYQPGPLVQLSLHFTTLSLKETAANGATQTGTINQNGTFSGTSSFGSRSFPTDGSMPLVLATGSGQVKVESFSWAPTSKTDLGSFNFTTTDDFIFARLAVLVGTQAATTDMTLNCRDGAGDLFCTWQLTNAMAASFATSHDNLDPNKATANVALVGTKMTQTYSDFAPAAFGSSFQFDTPQQQVLVHFTKDVITSLAAGDFVLRNLTAGTRVANSVIKLVYDEANNLATLTFPGLPAGVLPDGNYHLAIAAASVADDNGHALRQNATLDFFTLDGDANHDRVVDVADLGRLATNYNVTVGMTFSDGDFNYDGKVDVADLGRLATNYGKTLAKPG